jgi:hypothetical protein
LNKEKSLSAKPPDGISGVPDGTPDTQAVYDSVKKVKQLKKRRFAMLHKETVERRTLELLQAMFDKPDALKPIPEYSRTGATVWGLRASWD